MVHHLAAEGLLSQVCSGAAFSDTFWTRERFEEPFADGAACFIVKLVQARPAHALKLYFLRTYTASNSGIRLTASLYTAISERPCASGTTMEIFYWLRLLITFPNGLNQRWPATESGCLRVLCIYCLYPQEGIQTCLPSQACMRPCKCCVPAMYPLLQVGSPQISLSLLVSPTPMSAV